LATAGTTDHGIDEHNAIVCYDSFMFSPGPYAGSDAIGLAVEVVCFTKYLPMFSSQRDGCIVTIDPTIEGGD